MRSRLGGWGGGGADGRDCVHLHRPRRKHARCGRGTGRRGWGSLSLSHRSRERRSGWRPVRSRASKGLWSDRLGKRPQACVVPETHACHGGVDAGLQPGLDRVLGGLHPGRAGMAEQLLRQQV